MTTAITTSPLESYQTGRDSFLTGVLDVMSGLEKSVLEFQHDHDRKVRAAGADLSNALREKARLEHLVGEQALELAASRSHVCAVPEPVDLEGQPVAEPSPVTIPEPLPSAESIAGSEETARTIAELRAALAAEQGITAGLRAELAAEKTVTGELRAKLAGNDQEIAKLDDTLDAVEGKLRNAAEEHTRYIREAEATFAKRLAEGVLTAETGVRLEAIRIIEAIAADNPALAEVADLFTVVFPAEADPAGRREPAPAQVPPPVPAAAAEAAEAPGDDFFAAIPAPAPAEAPTALQAAAEPAQGTPDAPAPMEDFFNNLPAPEHAPAPMTQILLPAPDLTGDAVLDPNFFDTQEPLTNPDPAQPPAEAPKPSHGLFGRNKENQNV